MPAAGSFRRLGICAGKETMFPRIARRRIPIPGWTGVFNRRSLWISKTRAFAPIKSIEESRPARMKIA
jgi:hypothetical protein